MISPHDDAFLDNSDSEEEATVALEDWEAFVKMTSEQMEQDQYE